MPRNSGIARRPLYPGRTSLANCAVEQDQFVGRSEQGPAIEIQTAQVHAMRYRVVNPCGIFKMLEAWAHAQVLRTDECIHLCSVHALVQGTAEPVHLHGAGQECEQHVGHSQREQESENDQGVLAMCGGSHVAAEVAAPTECVQSTWKLEGVRIEYGILNNMEGHFAERGGPPA